MALSLTEKLAQAAKTRIGNKAAETEERLRRMEETSLASEEPKAIILRDPAPHGAPDAPPFSPETVGTLGHTGLSEVTPSQTWSDQARPDQTWTHTEVSPGQARNDQTTPGLTRFDQTVSPENTTGSDLVRPQIIRLTRQERTALAYIKEIQERVVPTKVMARTLAMPVPTLYKIIRRLRDRGHILAEKDGNDGTYLKFLAWEAVRPGLTVNNNSSGLSGHSRSDLVRPAVTRSPPSLERKRESLSLSQKRVEATWPTLAAAGFGTHQIEQIVAALVELGKPTDRIVQSLDHAEWELESGKMADKDGRPVADPCSWVFRSLSRTGYYRRPQDYVSPEEQAARDEEAQARSVALARQKAEQAQFETWRDGLSQEEHKDALQGHPGGSKDAWLRRVWKERHAAKGPSG